VSVSTLLNALQPTGITGPPEVMFGLATVTGDASGGTAILSFVIPPGFMWMPQLVSFQAVASDALDYEIALIDLEDNAPASSFEYTITREIAAVTTIETADAFILPRMLIKVTNRNSVIRCRTANVTTVVYRMYVRMLRWPKNAQPEAWQAFLVAPP